MNLNNAIQIRIIDKAVQAYLQQYPFGFGREPTMNQAALANLRQGLQVRPQTEQGETVAADPANHGLAAAEAKRIKELFEGLSVPRKQQRWAWEVLAWKAARIPRQSHTILSIGCGGGVELILIHALLPAAVIFAVDFQDAVLPAVKTALDLRFVQGHFNDFLMEHEHFFDVVFCNHVLEHLYEPESTLSLIRRCLKPSGRLIAGLPMEGCADGVFAEAIRRIADHPAALHPLDIGILDAGHAWKTNPADLRATLAEQGFVKIQLHVRSARHLLGLAVRRRMGVLLYELTFGATRSALKRVFPASVPWAISKAFLAAERRCWFGANRLKNQFAKEVLVEAQVAR